MLQDLKEIIAIDSVYSTPRPNAPFGKKARAALDWFLEKSKAYGFKTGEKDGYCGWAEIGEGNRLIGVVCHLDVVPAGEGWTYPPYCMTVEGGRIYGRGVADDKGALVACMHAMKNILDSGEPLDGRIRIIVGCNEENGSACMKHYVKHCEIPSASIVPDADFPIINSEKGIIHYLAKVPLDKFFKDNILSLGGGVKDNVVPDRAKMTVKKDSPLYMYLKGLSSFDERLFKCEPFVSALLGDGHELKDFALHDGDDGLTIETCGIAGHAMDPEKGDNAIWKLFCLLASVNDTFPSEVAQDIYENICSPLSCEKIGFACSDEQSGDTTCNLGVISMNESTLDLELNIRIPICCDKNSIAPLIKSKLPKDSEVKEMMFSPNLFIDKDSPLIKTLLDVYGKVTGNETYCLKTGGGTYAKELPGAVAFGPTFPGTQTDLHNADENLPVKEFEKLFDIYRAAMLALDKAKL
ncbi:MAG: M20 family metallopeptidase [Clostridia bacterium]|nr:M20 family metallopeptidase [Clostridia bacterium]